MAKAWLAAGVRLLAAVRVPLARPGWVGVPEIPPVAVLMVRPAGSAPLLIDQVIGPVPVAVQEKLNGTPTVPLLGARLVIVRGLATALTDSVALADVCMPVRLVTTTLNTVPWSPSTVTGVV